jgi:PAS domain S-box-containing protein
VEKKLRGSKFESLAPSAEMKSLLDHSDRSTLVLDSKFRILWFNEKAAREMYSFFKEELKTGNSYWNYVNQDRNKRFIRNFNAAMKGRTISTEQKIHKPGGTHANLWIEGRFSPLLNSEGVAYGIVYSYVNISDRKLVEKEKLERTQVLEAVDHNDSQAFVLLDKLNRILSHNKLAVLLFPGFDEVKEYTNQNVLEHVYSDWKTEFDGGIKIAKSGGSVAIEFEKPNDEHVVIEVRFSPVKNGVTNEPMVSIWAFDISDKRQAANDVKRSEENLRAVFDSSSQTFYLLDRKLNILAFNQAAAWMVNQQFGYELQNGSNALDITAKENLVQFRVETERAFSGRKVQVEKHFSFNGIEYWFDRHINPVKNAKGEIDRITIWSINITDRKKAEKALKENESKFRKLASLLPVGIYQVDVNGNTTYVNESLQLIIGADLTSILDGTWTKQIHASDKSMVRSRWNTTEKIRKPFSLEYRFKKRSGESVYVLEQAQPLFNHLGEYRGYLGTVVDVSEQKRTQVLLQEKKVTENSLRFRSDFLASMSHEIRTPLNGIMGLSEILLGSKLDSEQTSKLQNILGASKDLRSIVNDVLNLSELEAGKVVLQKETFNVSELIETIAERYEPEAKAKKLTLSFDTPDIPITLESDRRRLTQVLSNLVRNAIKFTERGSVFVSVVIKDKNQVLFEVKDTGPGIPAKDQKKLFKDFSQLQHTTAQNLEGTGLGLSISKKMMHLLGGQIGVKSKVGKGSAFWLSLSFEDPENRTAKESFKPTPKQTKKKIDGIRVLLVEDNLINQQAFKIMLQRMGCKVDVLSNGKQAVENFGKGTYDIVFMDIQMPEMDGLEATTTIKKQFEKVPPIIGLSGNILQRDSEGNLKSDMDDLLLKPVVSNDIERMIKKWVA